MAKTLIIAEKPSVAGDIAKALGGFTRHGEYFESDDYVLSSAVGHLLEIAAPEEFEVKRGKWSFANLPVIPPHFDLNPIAKSEPRLKVLAKLLKRKDVTALINACDAGREGELIFRYIAQATKTNKPVSRLWLQSMTPAAIRDGFAHLRTDDDMQPLADAAVCRSESDWLVGINGTRAMTAFNSRNGGFLKTPVGRVQTPTLTILVAVLAAFGWMSTTSYLRTAVFKEKARDYVAAARLLGASTPRIIFRQVLPNVIAILVTLAPFKVAGVITSLAALDFLGFGLPPGSPSLGELIAQGKNNLQAPWLGITGFFVVSVMLSLLVFIGEAVRDSLDPNLPITWKLELNGSYS